MGLFTVRWPLLVAAAGLGWLIASVPPHIGVAAGGGATIGPFGPQGPRMREQLWMLPSASAGVQLRATVFRPEDDRHRHPMVVINHGTSEATRHAVSLPVYYWLSRWFVERGYVVVLPQRRGHGATGGPLVEARGTCADPDHYESANIAADDIAAVVDYMSRQSFVAPRATVVAGVSTGGFAALALAARRSEEVAAVVNFAGGRGGHAWGQRNEICGPERLVDAARRFGGAAKAPTLWLYSRNDSYFGPEIARAMAAAWSGAGGRAELHVLPAYGQDGHSLADDHAGWQLWGAQLESFLARSVTAGHRVAGANGSPPAILQPASLR